jgi:hypothetical protein
MLIDKQLMFHDGTLITTAAEYKGSSLALAVVGEMLRESKGEALEVLIQIVATCDIGTSLEFETVTANDAALTTEIGQYKVLANIPTAQCLAGRKFRLPLHQAFDDGDATHFGVQITAVGTTATVGAVSAWIQRAGEDQNSF